MKYMTLDAVRRLLPTEPNGPPPPDFEGFVAAAMQPYGECLETTPHICYVETDEHGERWASGVPASEIERHVPLPDIDQLQQECDKRVAALASVILATSSEIDHAFLDAAASLRAVPSPTTTADHLYAVKAILAVTEVLCERIRRTTHRMLDAL